HGFCSYPRHPRNPRSNLLEFGNLEFGISSILYSQNFYQTFTPPCQLPPRVRPVCWHEKSTPFRFLAVILTLTMMAGYVVYSRQPPRVTAPDSKFAIMPAPASLSLRSESRTNSLTIEEVYATSSKSGTPLVKVPGFTQPAPVQQGLPSGLKIDASF